MVGHFVDLDHLRSDAHPVRITSTSIWGEYVIIELTNLLNIRSVKEIDHVVSV